MPRKASAARGAASTMKVKTRHIFRAGKRTYKKKPLPARHPKYLDEQMKLARKYKARGAKRKRSLERQYNAEIDKRYKHLSAEDRRRIKKRRLTFKLVDERRSQIVLTSHPNRGKHKGEYRVIYKGHPKGKWLTSKQFSGLMYRTKRKAIIDHYKALYNLSTKEARALYKSMRGKWGWWVRAALY